MPLEIVLSPGQDADITHAAALLGDHEPGAVLGDKGYDSDASAATAVPSGGDPVLEVVAELPGDGAVRALTRWLK